MFGKSVVGRLLSGLLAFTLTAGSAVALSVLDPNPPAAQAAPPGSAFDPGHIIADAVFYDGNAITADEVQSFLEARVTTCRAVEGGPPCLKDFVGEMVAKPAVAGKCGALAARPQATAAEMIVEIGRACGINPKVLVVTLQKEQGLVTSTKPTEYMYRAAMGYGCPDSDPAICGKVFVGLFNQLYNAAGQFRWYGNSSGSFTWLKPGRTVSVRYNPKQSCGSRSFPLVSQATAALYYYTPYTPNTAALDNLYGTGDGCSAYGNRNFWRFYHDWFGNPLVTDAFVADDDGTKYLISGGKSYEVTDSKIAQSLAPLEPATEVSNSFISSITSGGEFRQLARSTGTGRYFLLVGGARYLVADCALAAHFAQDCDTATPMSSEFLLKLTNGGELTQYLKSSSSGTQFWVEDGELQPLGGSVTVPVSPPPLMVTLDISLLTEVTLGNLALEDHTLYPVLGSTDLILAFNNRAYRVSGRFAAEIPNLTTWFKTNANPLPAELLPIDSALPIIAGVFTDGRGKSYVVSIAGKHQVAEVGDWSSNVPVLPNQVVDRIPTVSGILSTPIVVLPRTAGDFSFAYVISDNTRSTVRNQAMNQRLLRFYGQGSGLQLSNATISLAPYLGAAIAPGSVVTQTRSTTSFLVDGTRRIQLDSAAHVSSVSGGQTFQYPANLLAPFQLRAEKLQLKVSCGGATFLLDGGKLLRIGTNTLAQYPGTATTLDNSTCHGLGVSDIEPVGQFVRDKSGGIYLIQSGGRYKFASQAAYESARGTARGFVDVSDYFISKLPDKGKPPAKPTLVVGDSVPSYNFGIAAPNPHLTRAAVSSSEASSPSPTDSSSEPEIVRYVVVAGDTLLRIANRFSTTVAAIQQANNLRDVHRIVVGQVLNIPTNAENPIPDSTPRPAETSAETSELRVHEVVAGDTLFGISRKYGVSASLIAELNKISNPNLLRIGQRLTIPNS